MPPRARRCVICHRLLGGGEDRWFPFCSERCRLVDLGNWAAERYRVPGEPLKETETDAGADTEKPDKS